MPPPAGATPGTKPPMMPPITKFRTNRAAPPPRESPPGTIHTHIRWMPKGRPQSIQSQRRSSSPFLMQADLKMQYSKPGDGDGQNCLLEKFLNGLGSRHWQHLHSCLHYTDKIRPRPGAFEKSGKAHNRLYSSSLLRCLCGSASLGFSSRASTFWRRVSYSRSSRWAFLYSDCRAVRLAVSLSISARSRLGGGQGYGVQAFQFPCRRLKQDDLPLMPPEEFLLVPGLAVLVIQGTELTVRWRRASW